MSKSSNVGKTLVVTQAPRKESKQEISKAQVRQMIESRLNNKVELKWFRFYDSAIAVDFGGGVAPLFAPSQGDTDVTRNGDRIRVEHIDLRYGFIYGDAQNAVRYIVFVWKPSTIPTVTNILESVGAVYAPYAHYSPDNQGNFTILYDKLHYIGTGMTVTGTSNAVHLKVNRTVQYTAGTTTGQNIVYRLVVSDSGAVTHPSVTSYAMTRFSDA